MSLTVVMFCPGCGERNDDTIACCTKCGLNLARLRSVLAEGDPDICSECMGDTHSDETILSGDGDSRDNATADPLPAVTGDTTSPEPAVFDNADPVQLKERGNELFRQEKFLDALDCYEKALAIDQFYTEAWYNKSMVLKKIGRTDQSKVCWGIYKRLSSGAPESQKNRQV